MDIINSHATRNQNMSRGNVQRRTDAMGEVVRKKRLVLRCGAKKVFDETAQDQHVLDAMQAASHNDRMEMGS